MNLEPFEDRLIVKPLDRKEVTEGGIVIPDIAKEKQQRGTVLAVGPGKVLDNGQVKKLMVNVGDEVLYGKYAGDDIVIDNETLKIIREGDVLARVGNRVRFEYYNERGNEPSIQPKPYMQPAVDKIKKRLLKATKKMMDKAEELKKG